MSGSRQPLSVGLPLDDGYVLVNEDGTLDGANAAGRLLLKNREIAAALTRFAGSADGGRFRIGKIEARVVHMKNGTSRLRLVCFRSPAQSSPAERLLTPMQREVARYAARGSSVAEIASALGRTKETVRTHLREIYRRLWVSTRIELARAINDVHEPVSAHRSSARDETRRRR